MALDGVVVRREECRDARGWAWLDALRQDTRHAARALRRAPVFTVVAIASLALGIGATGALFAVVDAVLVRPLPLPAAERLVWIEESRNGEIVGGTPDRLRDWAALAGVEAAGGFAEPATLSTVIRGIAAGLGDDLAVEHLRTLDEHVAVATREPRTRTFTVVSFAVVALLLAALGLYGLLAGEVAARTQEFGVRLTLGARPRQILGQTLGRGLRLAVVGLGLGLAATPWLVRFIEGLLVGVGPSDALALMGATLVLVVTAVLACAGPAWRAARVDPRVALRHE